MPLEAELSSDNPEIQEQLEWDRLQSEALAAQRYRLEQEMQQARQLGLLSADTNRHESFMGINWNYRLSAVCVILLIATIGGIGYLLRIWS